MQNLRDALLSTQRALLGAVVPSLRAVLVEIDNKLNVFCIRFYYDGLVSQDLIDLWHSAITEASAGLDSNYDLDESVERLDYPAKIPARGCYAYLRKE
jgi:hypothetical protein